MNKQKKDFGGTILAEQMLSKGNEEENFVDPENIPAFEDAPKPLTSTMSALRGVAKPSTKVEQVPTLAPMPFLRVGKPASSFRQLKKAITSKAGFDFLAICADVMRSKGFNSNKIGVAYRSRHKCGDAFDVNQNDKRVIVVSEPHGTQQFFRVWLKCEKQDGSLGIKTALKDIRGFKTNVYVVDFTAEAERLGWQRIPAWKGWSLKGSGYNKMEWWHYQCTEGLSWDEAIDFLYNDISKVIVDSRKPAPERIIGLNDRGSAVKNIQEKLSRILDKNKVPYLPRDEVDGVFGKITQTAVKRLQEDYGLVDDGLVGPHTRELLERLTNK